MNWILKIVGWKTLLKFLFRKFIIPKLRKWAQTNELPNWDEKLVDELEDNYAMLIDMV